MAGIAALGDRDFTLGFTLAGVKRTFPGTEAAVREALASDISIVIISEDVVQSLSEYCKERMMTSVRPVFVAVSKEGSSDDLRAMIRKSIGIDIWAQ